MIVLNLACGNSHRFEGWFASGDDFQHQAEAGGVVCPVCSDTRIIRLPTGPYVKRSRSAGEISHKADDSGKITIQDSLRVLTRALIQHSEDVGDRFPDEARKIHYEEGSPRSIHGIATPEETSELIDEGIPVLLLPTPSDKDIH